MRIRLHIDVDITDPDKLIEASGVAVPAAGDQLVFPTDDVRVSNVFVLRVLQAMPDFSDAGFIVTSIGGDED